MFSSLKKIMYNGLCVCAALSIAFYALLPVSAATANAINLRGGQACPTHGCHNENTDCTGAYSCTVILATACLTGPKDRNSLPCGNDSGLCSNSGCGGQDVICGFPNPY
jgi:hypothetical protein